MPGNINHSKKEGQEKYISKAALVLCYRNVGFFCPLAHESQAKDMVRDAKLRAEGPLGLLLELFVLGDARHHCKGCMD